MASFTGKFESARQDWTTPRELFDPINSEFNFTLDAAADSHNALAARFIGKEQNALKQNWGQEIVWLNPPYGDKQQGRIVDWVRKAWEASTEGATVVMLIPARTNTNWFHDFCLGRGEVRFIKGRPKFGDAKHGLPQPLCFVIFRP